MTFKKEIIGKKTEDLPIKAMIAPKMQDFLFEMKKLGFSLSAVRFVLIISANLKEEQELFRGEKEDVSRQLTLFDNDWMDLNKNISLSKTFSFNYSNFMKKGSKNQESIKEAIRELQSKNYRISFVKIDEKGNERLLTLESSFIGAYIHGDGSKFKIEINNFWYKALVDVSVSFNDYLKSMVFDLGQNALILYFYLRHLPVIRESNPVYESLKKESGLIGKVVRGTGIKYSNFVQLFCLNYTKESDIRRRILDPIRNELNKFSDFSFNYKFSDNKIYLITYEMSSALVGNGLVGFDVNRIKQAIEYKILKYEMDEKNIYFLIEIYLKYTYDIVLKATNKNRTLVGKKGEEYIILFQRRIEEYIFINDINLKLVEYTDKKEKREELVKLFFHKKVLSLSPINK